MTDTRVLTEKFTRRDYMRLPEGFPAELIEGSFVREPAPTCWHQNLGARLVVRLQAVAGIERVAPSPIDVFIDDETVLQPDVLVTLPDAPIGPATRHVGMPLIVVEILLPSTARRDRDVKKDIYLRAGVAEVWIVDPDAGTIDVHTAGGAVRVAGEQRADSAALPGFTLSWSDLAGPRAGSPRD